jgi:hypothetical protein
MRERPCSPLPSALPRQGRLTRRNGLYGSKYVLQCHTATQRYPQTPIPKQGPQGLAILSLGSASTRTGSRTHPSRRSMPSSIRFVSRAAVRDSQFAAPPPWQRLLDAPQLTSCRRPSAHTGGRFSSWSLHQAHSSRYGIRRPLSNKRREGLCALALRRSQKQHRGPSPDAARRGSR